MIQKFIQDLNSEVKKAIRLLTGRDNDDNYSYHYQLVALNKHQLEGEETHKPRIYNLNPDNFIQEVRNLTALDEYDRYICPNPIKGTVLSDGEYNDRLERKLSVSGYCTGKKSHKGLKPVSRNQENIFAYKAIVLDIDWHGEEPDVISESVSFFRDNLEEIMNGLPLPNVINFTGRGLQLIYAIEILSKQLKWLYDKTCKSLFDKLKDRLNTYKIELNFPELDSSVTFNSAALIRMPGTVNTCAHLNTYIKVLSEKKYNINDICRAVEEEKETIKPVIFNKKRKYRNFSNNFTINSKAMYYENLLKKRVDFIIEKAPYVNEGEREIFCFAAYNTFVPIYGREEAERKVMLLNKRFRKPLSEKEIRKCVLRTYKGRHGADWIWFTQRMFVMYMGETLESAALIYGYGRKNKESRAAKTQKKKVVKAKKRRDDKIIEVYTDTENKAETAKKCNVSRTTVYKVLEENKKLVEQRLKAKELMLQRKMFAAYLRNRNHNLKDFKEIGKRYGVPEETAREKIQYFKRLKRKLHRVINTDNDLNRYYNNYIKQKGMWSDDCDFIARMLNKITGIDIHEIHIALNPNLRYLGI